jgi:hypothetical protein
MKSTRVFWLLAVVAVLAIVLLPPVLSSVNGGWFYAYRCACGHPVYVHVKGDGLFGYSPGHGVPEHRNANLRRRADGGWDVLALAPDSGSGMVAIISDAPKAGSVCSRMRIRGGTLYEESFRDGSSAPRVYLSPNEPLDLPAVRQTNETRYSRVYNPWPIWLAQLREKWNL